ncbi:LOW QUALITY PROTEIN: hypothetical protein KUTeg_015877 [Tegillarca granosa]|uniref:Uncharacterized protein n=1 Tax=Tegillarca granosa TaxID=220873 RepID=A0ABQ9EJ70_TEGGR|nr:LOW QUALITY PROTEIN: hypothetical protein KUTeg_015877 [Tegillarca granosa]
MPKLVALATSDVATEEITTSLLVAEGKGIDKFSDFVEKRLETRIRQIKSERQTGLYFEPSCPVVVSTLTICCNMNCFHYPFHLPIHLGLCCLQLKNLAFNIFLKKEFTLINCHHQTTPCTIIDGQALVVALGKPRGAKTFGDLAKVYVDTVFNHAKDNCTRIDVVFDRYDNLFIKGGTRDKRGTGRRPITRIFDNEDVPLPPNWSDFISHPENKSNLACLLSNELLKSAETLDTEIVTAGGFSDRDYAESLFAKYERNIVICLWFQTGTSKRRKFIPVHNIRLSISETEMLPPFHVITGCDTVSKLSGHSKKQHLVFLRGTRVF